MHRFFDGPEDMADHIRAAEAHIMPAFDLIDEGGVKYRTACFILFTRKAVLQDGLTREHAHLIIDGLFDAILGGDIDNVIEFKR